MGDLISRSALLNLLAAYGNSERKTDYDNGWDDARDEIAREVKYAETVDAEPVRHGRWMPKPSGYCWPEDKICSECGAIYSFCKTQNYCPNCGARMDGGT